jgi:hypothetical protein
MDNKAVRQVSMQFLVSFKDFKLIIFLRCGAEEEEG